MLVSGLALAVAGLGRGEGGLTGERVVGFLDERHGVVVLVL